MSAARSGGLVGIDLASDHSLHAEEADVSMFPVVVAQPQAVFGMKVLWKIISQTLGAEAI